MSAPERRRLLAITRAVGPSLARCELTHVERQPIDVARAAAQHGAYEARLAELGCELLRLPAEPDLPDAVFVEDTAVVLDELAVVTRPGAASRRPETASVAAALQPFRRVVTLQPPATLDGGDVLVVGRTLFVGASGRTNGAGIEQLRAAVAPHGYAVVPVPIDGCLHLKSAATLVGEALLLVQPAWIPAGAFPGLERLAVDPGEPFAANALLVGGAVVHAEEFPRTRERLLRHGLRVATVPASELAKAEGGVTCCSLIFAP